MTGTTQLKSKRERQGGREARFSDFRIETTTTLPGNAPARAEVDSSSKPRFTIDGSAALENVLSEACRKVLAGVQEIVPSGRLEGLVLGGGYGRGQGGVLQTAEGERPYNDMEFYVFVRGNLFLAQRRFRAALNQLGERLSPQIGLHVEFKLDSLEKLRRSRVTMYSYDLVAGNKILFGDASLFHRCEHHLDAAQIPASEATRLLFNRCSGLLLVQELLRSPSLDVEQCDFIGRNLAKAQLGFGDAVLTIFGRYHWDCRERHESLNQSSPAVAPSWLAEVRRHHAEGVQFKLHPHRASGSLEEFKSRFAELHDLGRRLWLWAESRRLDHNFETVREYALSILRKCPESSPVRNGFLNLRTCGRRTLFTAGFLRYPRERLFNALCLLLWDDEICREPGLLRYLQKQLGARTKTRDVLMAAYRRVWENYG